MKRYVSLVCIFCLFVMFVAKPIAVSASSFEPVAQPMVNLFDISDNDNRFYEFSNGSISIPFSLSDTYVEYIEFLFFTDYEVTSVEVSNINCQLFKVGDYYRAVCLPRYVFDRLTLTITGTGGSYVVISNAEFISYGYSESRSINTNVYSTMSGVTKNYSFVGSSLGIATNDIHYVDSEFELDITFSYYAIYDFINVFIDFNVVSINSITASVGNKYLLPVDVNFISNRPLGDTFNNDLSARICIDLRDGNLHDLNQVLHLVIKGTVKETVDNMYYAYVLSINGFVLTDSINPVIFWFRKTYHGLNTWFDSLLDVLQNIYNGNTAPGNSFQQQVDQKDQQLEDMAAVMESVDQPDLNSINVSANTYVDGTVLAASMSGITSVFSEGLFFDMIVMSIMMATAGYVLFGKR